MSPNDKARVSTIAVIGAGTMGQGIVQVFAQNGFDVLAYDAFEGAVDKAVQRIEKILTRLVEKGKIEESAKRQAIGRIQPCGALSDFASADIAIEAATEKPDIKEQIFKEPFCAKT